MPRESLYRVLLLSSAFLLLSTTSILPWVPERTISSEKGTFTLSEEDSLFLMGDHAGASKVLDSLLFQSPTNSTYLHNRALMAELLGEAYHNANLDSLTTSPGNLYPYLQWYLGRKRMSESLLTDAEVLFEEALSQRKGFHLCRMSLAECYLEQGKLREAYKAIKPVLKAEKTYVEAHLIRHDILMAIGKERKATKLLWESCKSYPHETILARLIQITSHDSTLQERLMQKYLERYPFGEFAEIYKEELPDFTFPTEQIIQYNNNELARVLPLGKKLTYDVKFGIIHLGVLEIDCLPGRWKGEDTFWMRYVVRTAPSLPFFSILDTFQVHMADDFTRMRSQLQNQLEDDAKWYSTYEVPDSSSMLWSRDIDSSGYWRASTVMAPPNAYDTFSMLWIAQQLVREGRGDTLTSIITNGLEFTNIELSDKKKDWFLAEREWKSTTEVAGRLKYAGIAGLTGKYRGWFSGDHVALPVASYFKLIVGRVKVKLSKIEDSSIDVELVEGFYREPGSSLQE